MCMWLKKITQCFLVMVLFIMTTAQPVLAEENDNNQTSLTELNKEKGM